MSLRKTTGSIVCPNCGRLVSVTAKQCISCGRRNPGLWGYGPLLQQLLGDGSMISLVTGACTILYVMGLLIDPSAILRPQGLLGFLSPSMQALDKLGMTGAFAMSEGRWWTLITANYLHGGLLHIFFNMMWLRQLGVMVEHFYGSARSFVIFTVAGVVGFWASDLVNIPFTVGASGSIFGLLGALIYYGRRRGGTFGAAVYRQVGTWTLVLFAFGFLMPAVNNIAHAGGFIGGLSAAMVLGFHEIRRESSVHRLTAIATGLLTLASFGLALYTWLK